MINVDVENQIAANVFSTIVFVRVVRAWVFFFTPQQMAIDADIPSLAPLNDGIQYFWSILAWFFKSPTPKQMSGVTFKFNGVFVQLHDNIIEARQTQALSVA